MPGKGCGHTATRRSRTPRTRRPPKGSAKNAEVSPRKQMKDILGEERLRKARFEIPNLTDVEAAHIRHGTSLAAIRRARKHNIRRGVKFKKSQ